MLSNTARSRDMTHLISREETRGTNRDDATGS